MHEGEGRQLSRRQAVSLTAGALALGWGGRDLEGRVRGESAPGPDPVLATSADDVPVWPYALAQAIRESEVSAPVAARTIGHVGVVAEIARVAAAGEVADVASLLGSHASAPPVTGRPVEPRVVVSAATSTVARVLLGPAGAGPLAAAHAQVARDVRNDDPALRLGAEVGLWMLEVAGRDGFAGRPDRLVTVSPTPGVWSPGPDTLAVEPGWGTLRPLAMPSADDCSPPPPPRFSTEAFSPLYQEAVEVMESVPAGATEEVPARWWADGSGSSPTPAGHWLLLAADLAGDQGMGSEERSELLAWLGIAMGDAFIAAWRSKYAYRLLRPEHYITAHLDPGWRPLLSTPAFPEFTSGHSVCSAAAGQVLITLVGDVPLVDRAGAGGGAGIRRHASVTAATEEASWSRLSGGIHFRCGIESGLVQGRDVGKRTLQRWAEAG